jgi:hypothetical protein
MNWADQSGAAISGTHAPNSSSLRRNGRRLFVNTVGDRMRSRAIGAALNAYSR